MLNNVIDLSHNNSLSDNAFHSIVSAGIKAIIHKATQGISVVDPTFADRKTRALSVGLLWGAYHFAGEGDPVAQANHFIDTTQGCKFRVLDWENTNGMDYAGAVAFVNRVKAVSGTYPLLYSGSAFLIEQLRAQGITTPDTTTLSNCPLWIARYSNVAPVIPAAWKQYTLWQYSCTGNVSGINGNVDRNYFNGDDAALTALFS